MKRSPQRLVADRYRRVWHLVEEIAANPGHSRGELAEWQHLSERQVQADLNIIRDEFRLPLVRRQGYCFASDDGAGQSVGTLTLRDALLLLSCLVEARYGLRDRNALNDLMNKVMGFCPAHLQPLLRLVADEAISRGPRPATTVCNALLAGKRVELRYVTTNEERTVEILPEMVVPARGRWFVIGQGRDHGRTRMLPLDGARAVTAGGCR